MVKTVETNTAKNKNEVLSECPLSLRALHDVFGYDFCKPYDIIKISGNYTVNRINKEAAALGYSVGAEIVVLTNDESKNGNDWGNALKAVQIMGDDFNIEFSRRFPWYSGRRSLDTFYSKGSFNELRKKLSAVAYVFVQERELMKLPAVPKREILSVTDLTERFNVGDVEYFYTRDNKRYVGGVEIARREGKGEKLKYKTGPFIGEYLHDISEIFDKSGYCVRERRIDLKRRAKALRAEREKAAYIKTDDASKIEELRGLIEQRKAEIAKQLIAAKTSKEMEAVEKAVAWYKGLGGYMASFERFERNTLDKTYSSIAESERAYNAIKAALTGSSEAA